MREIEKEKREAMLNIGKKTAFMLFALTTLVSSLLLANLNIPAGAQTTDSIYLHGPPLQPIHMHSNITLKPIHMHLMGTPGQNVLFPGDPRLEEPNSTTDWHELYPDYSEEWHLSSWEDLGDPFFQLSPNDQIDMTNIFTEEVQWFHVDRMTITLILSGPYGFPWHEPAEPNMALELKWPFYDPYIITDPNAFNLTMWHEVWPGYSNISQLNKWVDDPARPDGQLSFTDSVSFDGGITWWHVEDVATDLILRWKMMDPRDTWWHELYPEYSLWHNLTSWESYPDPYCDRISPGDTIDMVEKTSQVKSWYFVDRVTITINVTDRITGDWMMLELKTKQFEEMYYYLKHPLYSLWHEVYPVYSNVYNLTWWDLMDPEWDNCNGVLDPSDHIVLLNMTSGLDRVYHIEDMAYDIILNRKMEDPVSTEWHELHPEYSNWYSVDGWTDNTFPGFLSPSDNVTLTLLPSGPTNEYHVENVTVTVELSFLGSPPETKFIEAIVPFEDLYWPKIMPENYGWHEVWPVFSQEYALIIWEDNCNGVLDFSDNVTLEDPAGGWSAWHVEGVYVDMVVKAPPTPVHDVAVTDVYSIYAWVYQGEIDPIVVTVENQGNFTETVDVYAFYAGNLAAPKQSITLNPGDSQILTFNWNTTGVPPGFYQVSANATIPIDDDPADNTKTGNTEEVRRRPPWFKKKAYPDYAPSGMPDFDQKQDNWFHPVAGGWTWCGPVSVANSLWWFDSKYESLNNPNPVPPPTISDSFSMVTAYGPWDDHDVKNVFPFVNNLAFLMDTDGQRTGLPHTGTYYIDLETGLSQYLQQQGINPVGDTDGDGDVDIEDIWIIGNATGTSPGTPGWDMRADVVIDNVVDNLDMAAATANFGQVGMFYEKTVEFPDFFWIEEEIERSEDVVLLLEFWNETSPGIWEPLGEEYLYDLPGGSGGHYVTSAGVNSTNQELLLSDPWWDAAEAGAPGHIPTPHPYPHTVDVHNDTSFVSHDAYLATQWIEPPASPYPGSGIWELVGYLQQMGYPPWWHTFIRAAIVTSPLAEHDVAVTNITTSKAGCRPLETVGVGNTVDINVTVTNEGGFTETFNVTVKANATVVETQNATLNPGQNQTLTFTWNTTGFTKGNYTIEATADVVPGETDTADNTRIYGLILVTITGDVDGNKNVDIFDIVRMAGLYGTVNPSDPNSDVDDDGDVDIFDIVAAATNYGKSW